MSLHDTEELDNDFRGRADKDLALATALSVDDVVQAVVLPLMMSIGLNRQRQASTHQDRDANHLLSSYGEEGLGFVSR